MARGNEQQTKVHYKGSADDYIIFVDSVQALEEWKKDSSVPLAQVVSGFKVFVTHKHGNQGVLDTASNQQLESEFGSSKEDDVVKAILQKGTVQESDNKERQGDTNITKGASVAH
ncbi:DUF1960-domain-containing protein [Massarina eburnea CBS 473.64]|uniref:DUF1960-domain-containing protein n=1 Tax=Massarina eburnea CBS 473.64 TaxID=1395130 RepID=A0A6A6RTH7_9PLEO|nr:DUF1960-domain-containing protein [Massarina eburnea CBS 473.64]